MNLLRRYILVLAGTLQSFEPRILVGQWPRKWPIFKDSVGGKTRLRPHVVPAVKRRDY